ncbi:MAG TPA: methyltransferase domain-containing protein [Thermoanaerobaculia bacterium]|jgi:trans-aconitate 2-methyltransferase|nr:methyltransferase domain-containing protein [Thermoanaerobaculia bacterium]
MWSPEQYERFAAERRQPFVDLLSLVEPRAGMRIVDLGCGTGELTRELHATLSAEETVGVDSSETMLLKAGHFDGKMLRFEKGDIEAFVTERPYDLIFSNAALHWVPDHEQLFVRLTNLLAMDGQIAVQMPANDSHPSHSVAAEAAKEFGVAPRADFVLPVEKYAELLYGLGYKRQHVRLHVYGHELPSSDDVVEWVRGALLTHYQSQLSAERFEEFLAEYRTRLRGVIGESRPFFYTYKRVLMWASF